MSHILLKELLSDLFSEKEKKGIMPEEEWKELDEDEPTNLSTEIPEDRDEKIARVRALILSQIVEY
jgi:hypothetical protein